MLRTYEPGAAPYVYDGEDASFTYRPRPFLEYQLEHALCFGLGSKGNIVLRELSMWQREWLEWRDVILPKFVSAFPGKRPAAGYIVGEWPLRTVEVELPLSHPYRSTRCVYVVGERDGFTYADLPEPYQRDEARHLHEHGIVEDDELRRYRGYGRAFGLSVYRWEVGR